MKLMFKAPLSVALTIAAFTGVTMAQDWYVGGSASWKKAHDSNNDVRFTGDFATGEGGVAVPAGTVLAAGTTGSFDTDFEDGYGASLEVGKRLPHGLRGALEVTYDRSGVEGHDGLSAGGTALDGEDVAVLTGDAVPFGVSVGDTLQFGRGRVENIGAFANAYYDFNRGGRVEPYVGAGLGVMKTSVQLNPSAVSVVKDDSTNFAYQLKAGATVRVNERVEVFGEYTYRASEDMGVESNLLPAKLEIENKASHVGLGLRLRF